MRTLVRSIAALAFLSALPLAFEGLRRLGLATLGFQRLNPGQTLLFTIAAILGVPGVAGSLLLVVGSEHGRRITIAYLLFLAGCLFAADQLAGRVLYQLLFVSSAACLLTGPARNALGNARPRS